MRSAHRSSVSGDPRHRRLRRGRVRCAAQVRHDHALPGRLRERAGRLPRPSSLGRADRDGRELRARTARGRGVVVRGERLPLVVRRHLQPDATLERDRAQLGTTKFVRRVEALRKQLEVEPLGSDFPQSYARVRAHLESAGLKIGDRDTIIAAHALAVRATLVTRNIREFARVPGLVVENWQAD